MISAKLHSGSEVQPLDRNMVERILRDYSAFRQGDTDPELEAVRVAILIEDVFGVRLSDADIEPSVLTGTSAVATVVARLNGAV